MRNTLVMLSASMLVAAIGTREITSVSSGCLLHGREAGDGGSGARGSK
jgi:hypothetical protein